MADHVHFEFNTDLYGISHYDATLCESMDRYMGYLESSLPLQRALMAVEFVYEVGVG